MKRIFYSWQSDAPRKVNHDFIGECLNEAAAHIRSVIGEELEVQDGVRGEPGTPAVADTILYSRIPSADVYVADISLVYKIEGNDGKRLSPNPNVAIEMGYAIASLSLARVVSVQNEHFGAPEDIPFDLKHLRWPLRYTLEPGASEATIAKKKSVLTRCLQQAIEQILKDERPRAAVLSKRAEVMSILADLVERNLAWKLALRRHNLGNVDLTRRALAITDKMEVLAYRWQTVLDQTSDVNALERIRHSITAAGSMIAGSPQRAELLSLDVAEQSRLRAFIGRVAALNDRLDELKREQEQIDSELADAEAKRARWAAELSESDSPQAPPPELGNRPAGD